MKKFIAILGLLCLVATPALALENPTIANEGPAEFQLLFEFPVTTFDAAGECANAYQVFPSKLSKACDSELFNSIVWPDDAEVEYLQAIFVGAGDSGFDCDFQIEVAATAVGTKLNIGADPTVNAINQETQRITLDKGDLVGVVMTDGDAACAGTADPEVIIRLVGKWVTNP